MGGKPGARGWAGPGRKGKKSEKKFNEKGKLSKPPRQPERQTPGVLESRPPAGSRTKEEAGG